MPTKGQQTRETLATDASIAVDLSAASGQISWLSLSKGSVSTQNVGSNITVASRIPRVGKSQQLLPAEVRVRHWATLQAQRLAWSPHMLTNGSETS